MLTSILRTIVPTLWGGLITWLIGVLPVLAPLKADLLTYGDLLVPLLASFIIGAWYALWRWAEPRLPAWIVRIVLGSSKAPMYASTVAAGGIVDGHYGPAAREVLRSHTKTDPDDGDGYAQSDRH